MNDRCRAIAAILCLGLLLGIALGCVPVVPAGDAALAPAIAPVEATATAQANATTAAASAAEAISTAGITSVAESPLAPEGSPTGEPSPTTTSTETLPPPTATPSPTTTPSPTHTPSPTPTDTATPTATVPPTPTPLPMPTPDGACRTVRVPILMYHYISEPPDPWDRMRTDLSVSPARFEEHLAYLAENGYQSITLDDLARALQVGSPLPPKPVILTFDDGHRDHYTEAFPLLQRYGYTGTFFVVTSLLDEERPDYLSWEQVTEMHAAGMTVAPHSYTHPDLTGRAVDYLVWQILGSKEAIEARTGETVRFFCYPLGRYDETVIEVLRSLDFWGAVLTEQGIDHGNGDLYTLRRVRVHGGYGAAELAKAIEYLGNLSEGDRPCTMTP